MVEVENVYVNDTLTAYRACILNYVGCEPEQFSSPPCTSKEQAIELVWEIRFNYHYSKQGK